MIDKKALDKAIESSGKSKKYLAKKLGISTTSFYYKRCNITEFSSREMFILTDELNLSEIESRKIFYPSN